MKHKIIQLTKDGYNNDGVLCKSILVEVARDEETGDDYIKISAWKEHAGNSDSNDDGGCYRSNRIDLPNLAMCESFVEDFTEVSAKAFADTFNC